VTNGQPEPARNQPTLLAGFEGGDLNFGGTTHPVKVYKKANPR